MERVACTEAGIKAYLDACINKWRDIRDSHNSDTPEHTQATCYVDAYQSMRTSIFGELLQDRHIGDPLANVAADWTGGEGRATLPPENGVIGDPNRR